MATTSQAATNGAPRKGLPFPLSPSEGWTTVLFAMVLVLITVGCIQSLNWTHGIDILTTTTLVGMALGFILAKQQFLPQSLADIPALALGMLYAFWQTAVADEGGHVGVLWRHLLVWVKSAQSGGASTDDAIFLLFLAVLTMLLGYVSMWLIFRSRSPWLAAAANGVVLLINLNYATSDKAIYAVLFLLAALLLIVRFNLVERLRIWRRKGLRYPPELTWDFMQAGVIFVIVVMVISATLPNNVVNGGLQTLWNGPNSPWQGVQTHFGNLFHVNGSNGSTKVAFGKTLKITGNVNLPTNTVLTYHSTTTTYLQGLTFDTFDGHQWSIGAQQTAQVPANSMIIAETNATTPLIETIHLVNAPDGSYIYTLGEAKSFSLATLVQADGIGLTTADQVGSYTSWQVPHPLQNGNTYQVSSAISTATATQLQAVRSPDAAPNLYSPAFLARYTQLPSDLHPDGPVYQDAAQWTANAKTMYDKLEALINGFQNNNFRYSQTNPDVPSDSDAADFFLSTGQGYCTWFATGMTMMARSLGIPTRVVEGFAPGTLDPKTQQYVVLGTSAHLWVQSYFPGYGWINFEPSVGFPQFTRITTDPGTTDDPLPPSRPHPVTTPTKTGTPTGSTTLPIAVPIPGGGGGNGVVTAVTISLSTLLALLLLLVVGVAVWWRLIFRRLSPISQTFARMALLGRFAGVRPTPSQTAAEYGALLAARNPDQGPEIESITDLYVRERWSPNAPESTATLGQRWQTVRARLLHQITRRRRPSR